MKFTYFVILLLLNQFSFTIVMNEGVLVSAQSQGHTIYYSCIATPPVSTQQIAACSVMYKAYNSTLQLLNAPLPIMPSLDPSPFSWSPYDVCRFETGHMALLDLCPSIP
jgi:hypothetical protein